MEQHDWLLRTLHNQDFSYRHYEQILRKLTKTHKFSNFLDCSTNDIILRHDIDLSLISALRMARIENKLGIRSTYFILFHATFYNPFSTRSYRIIKEILHLGHNLGLHYDSEFIINSKLNPSEVIREEIEIMEHHFNTKINAIAMHNPSINKKIKIKISRGIEDADSIVFKTNRKYISDSVQNWREGCFCQHDDSEQLHLLIHPIWWTKQNLKREKILRLLARGELSDHQKELKKISSDQTNYLFKLKK